ncbi:hypothetical protein FH039_01240 [Thermococcus indicus]|uniref:Uncharacterized protein n=1 Tax=Thermococcus indicus TaxID=2586643 RepID=A0A4Y5SKL9_9EURY|nr:hypothetical protein [Thermococcus indicus]QDA30510.1 hypothetical protein FH039_01240 [Thermococcus indicus]
MNRIASYALPLCFIIQAVLNLVFYGFPSLMFSVLVPHGLFGYIAWALPLLVLGYFATGVLSLYALSFLSARRGKQFGAAYFGIGSVGSALVLVDGTYETPMLLIIFALWLVLSLIGIVLLFKGVETSRALSIVAMVLLAISAVVSASLAQWVVEDYYAHVHIGEIPENATVIVAYPENVSPPNGTG